MLISTRFAAGTVLYLAEIFGCKACFAGMASSYRMLVSCPDRALVLGSDKYISALRKHKHIDIQLKRINRCR